MKSITADHDAAGAGIPVEKLSEQLTNWSQQVSAQLRTILLGVLGLDWLLILKVDDVKDTVFATIPRDRLLWVAAASLMILIMELIQYVLGEALTRSAIRRAEAQGLATGHFDAASKLYIFQRLIGELRRWGTVAVAAYFVAMLAVAALAGVSNGGDTKPSAGVTANKLSGGISREGGA